MATEVLGSEPTVFVLDNVHLMDEMSWKLIIQVSAGVRVDLGCGTLQVS